MKDIKISPLAFSEDVRKIGIFLLLAGTVGFFIGAEAVRYQPEAVYMATVGFIIWLIGLTISK